MKDKPIPRCRDAQGQLDAPLELNTRPPTVTADDTNTTLGTVGAA